MMNTLFCTQIRITLLAIFTVFAASNPASAVIAFSGTDFSETFDSLGAGPSVGLEWSNNTTLAGWYAYQSNVQGGEILPSNSDRSWGAVADYQRSIGQSSPGSLLNLGNSISSTNRSLGAYSQGHDFTIALVLRNDSLVTFNSINVSYIGEQWQVNTNLLKPSIVLDFSYGVFGSFSSGPLNPNSVVPNSESDNPAFFMNGFTDPVGAVLDFAAIQSGGTIIPLDGNAAANRAAMTATLPLLWQPGEFLVLRWFDDYKFGDTQAVLAINDLHVSATAIPEPASSMPVVLSCLLLAFRKHTQRRKIHRLFANPSSEERVTPER